MLNTTSICRGQNIQTHCLGEGREEANHRRNCFHYCFCLADTPGLICGTVGVSCTHIDSSHPKRHDYTMSMPFLSNPKVCSLCGWIKQAQACRLDTQESVWKKNTTWMGVGAFDLSPHGHSKEVLCSNRNIMWVIPRVAWLVVPVVCESVNHYGISTKQKQHVPSEKVCMSFWSGLDVSPASNLDPTIKRTGLPWSGPYLAGL